jgi:hypothetical protein
MPDIDGLDGAGGFSGAPQSNNITAMAIRRIGLSSV